MKVIVQTTKSGLLAPFDAYAEKMLKKAPKGKAFTITMKEAKNPGFHRLAFGLAACAIENCRPGTWCEGKDSYYFIKSAMVTHGFTEPVLNRKTGEIEDHPLSLSDDKCSNELLDEIFRNAICPDVGEILGYEAGYIAKNYELILDMFGLGKGRGLCEDCHEEPATETHHFFENTKDNRALYGKLLDDPKNTIRLGYKCHHDKNPGHISEQKFCELMGIETRSKTGKL
jgi:hypothetical protein